MTNEQRRQKLLECERLLKKTKDGYTDPGEGIYWPPALKLLHEVQADLKAPAPPALVYPIANPDFHVLEGGLHETAPGTGSVAGNWAIDFICKAGLGVVAVENAVITRFSGRDPSDDQADADGVYGWSTWYKTPKGYHYFCTHQGRRYPTLRVGMSVKAGDLIGFVGDQRYRADHIHLGVTSPKSEADAKARILAVAKAPRVS